ncbi:hypothetical protein J3E69DRAFT_333979 [Trichoderma sp. SZMC 28015]
MGAQILLRLPFIMTGMAALCRILTTFGSSKKSNRRPQSKILIYRYSALGANYNYIQDQRCVRQISPKNIVH